MARSRLYKYLIRLIFGLVFLVLLGFGALVAWVVTGPRSLNALKPYIESALAPAGSDYKVNIEGCELIWEGWAHPVGIHAKNVDILDNKSAVIAHFPDVGVRLYFFELLAGKANLKSIELIGPVAKLVEDEKGNITSFGFNNEAAGASNSVAAALALLTSETGDNPITHLKSFIIRHASLSVVDSQGQAFLTSDAASLEIMRQNGEATGRLVMPLQFDGKHSLIDSHFTIDGNHKSVSSNIVFSEVPSAVLHALAPTQKWMGGVRVPLSGRANVTSDFDANIDAIEFDLETGAGTIDFPDQFEQTLKPERITLAGSLTDHLNTFTVKESLLDFGTHSITFTGKAYRQGDDYGVDGIAETQNVAIDDVHLFWPLKLAPHSRHWVTTHISKGRVVKANAILHFKPGEFKLKDTPDADIDATLVVKGVTIAYKPSHPPITDMDGQVRFTGKTMDAKINSAKYLDNTHITSARARFPDFYPDDVRMFLDMDIDTTAGDVQRFLALPDLNKSAKLGLTKDIAGKASGSAKLDFIAFSENGKDDVGETGRINYSIAANLQEVSQDHFLGNHDVADANMKLAVDNKGVKLSGRAKINRLPMNIELISSFAQAGETTYVIKTDMPVARLPDFGLPRLDFAKGVMGVNGTFFSSDNAEKADVALDLTHTAINLPQHGFLKKEGDRASLKFTTEKLSNGNTLVDSFTLKDGEDISSGKAEFDRTIQDFNSFSFSPLKLGAQDLDSLTYRKSGNVIQLSAKGRVFDASPYLANSSAQKSGLGYAIDMQTGKLLLGNNRDMNDVTVVASCSAEICKSAHINAKLRDGTPFVYVIGTGKLYASCDNAGGLARTMGILNTIEGGKLQMKGQYNDGKLAGELDVTDYTIKNAPVFTKIFTIASLTGILDTLSGNGIHFSKLTAPFVYHDGIVILKEAKTHGSALGLTADGVIDTNKSTLDLTGLLVPSYTLNSLVGNIPLLGDIITGGSGKGLVALSYGIHGDMKDPSVRVNPLSVLTPGFLRDIFDVFDKPAPDMDALEAVQKKAAGMKDNNAPVVAPVSPAIQPPSIPAIQPINDGLPSIEELKQK